MNTSTINNLLPYEKQCLKHMHFPFFGAFSQQHPQSFNYLNELLNTNNFTNIIELGTHDAGLSIFFAMYSFLSRLPAISDNADEPTLYKNNTHHKSPKNFTTIDIVVRDHNMSTICQKLGSEVIVGDILFDINTQSKIIKKIQSPGKTLLVSDNGDKNLEFKIFAQYLKPGDYIISHDYFRNEESFKESGWGSWETKKEELTETIIQYDLEETSTFLNDVYWFCAVKK